MSRLCLYACLAALFVCPGVTFADPITFAVTSTGQFGGLDLGSGAFTAIGGTHDGAYAGLGNLSDGTLVAVDGLNAFVRIDRTSGAVTTVGPTGINAVTSASLLAGDQFATDTLNNLYRINPNTGAAALVGPTGIPFAGFTANGLAGDAASLYYLWESTTIPSTLYRLDLATGLATAVGPTGTTGLAGAGFADGTLYAYSTAGTTRRIYSIDLATGAATPGPNYPQNISIFGSNSGQPSPVPEPGTWILFGLGSLGLLSRGWRRQAG
jgi:hypothetical protein